jgi:hypothetical protein
MDVLHRKTFAYLDRISQSASSFWSYFPICKCFQAWYETDADINLNIYYLLMKNNMFFDLSNESTWSVVRKANYMNQIQLYYDIFPALTCLVFLSASWSISRYINHSIVSHWYELEMMRIYRSDEDFWRNLLRNIVGITNHASIILQHFIIKSMIETVFALRLQ